MDKPYGLKLFGIFMVSPLAAFALLNASPIFASEGIVEINQVRALAGNITSGDSAGFPVIISQRGSYKLTSNLTVPDVNTSGVIITADDVTIDLNGFSVVGPATAAGPDGSGLGIRSDRRAVVYNGTIRGMGDVGVQLGSYSRAEKLQVVANKIGLSAAGAIISEINANQNRAAGISVANGSTVTKCVVYDNLGDGIVASIASSIIGNIVKDNHGVGILAGSGGLVLQNVVNGSTSYGLSLDDSTAYGQNVVSGNNGSSLNPQVLSGLQIGANSCGERATCP
jgi:hypothetical protein